MTVRRVKVSGKLVMTVRKEVGNSVLELLSCLGNVSYKAVLNYFVFSLISFLELFSE